MDSGVWVLADIEAWFLGKTSCKGGLDPEAYQRVIHKAVYSLPDLDMPLAPINEIPPAPTWLSWAQNVMQRAPDTFATDLAVESRHVGYPAQMRLGH
jgi:hypothetical protein